MNPRHIIEITMLITLALFLYMPEIKDAIRKRKIRRLMTCPKLLED